MTTDSPYRRLAIPDVDIWALLFERQIAFPEDKVIYIDPERSGRQYTYLDVKTTARAFGQSLAQWDWQEGDVMGLFALNCIDTPALAWGTLWARGVVSPANPAYSAAELAFQLRDSTAKALLTQAPLLETALEAAKIAGIPRSRILLIGDEKSSQAPHFTDFLSSPEKVSPERAERNAQPPSALAFLAYSSGTTGLPKGVMLTHGNIVSNLFMLDTVLSKELQWNGGVDGRGDTVLSVLPFYHCYGLTLLIHHALFAGLRNVVLPKFDLGVFCQTIQDYKVTNVPIVPPILLGLAQSPIVANYDLSSLKYVLCAAAPVSVELIRATWARLKIPVKQAYGLTETSPGAHMQEVSDWQTAMGSIGRLLPNQTAKIVSESGATLPPGSAGELYLKGPNIFAGYWRNPSATANCMTSDGFFKTGDISYQNERGDFFITDRLKELIKYKGFQVAPAELEGILIGSDLVADACVVGLYEESLATELPVAFIVRSAKAKTFDDDATLAKEIRRFLDAKVASHKRLRGGVRFVDEIPKSAAGKILRRILKSQLLAERDGGRIKANL